MSWVSKTVKKFKNHARKYLGDVGYGIAKTIFITPISATGKALTGDFKGSMGDVASALTLGIDKKKEEIPARETDEAPVSADTAALAAAMEEEEGKRKKKRGFAANVFGSDFRFGGATPAVKNNTDGQL